MCEGNYTVSEGLCVEIVGQSNEESGMTFVTRYVNEDQLSHTLRVKGGSFTWSSINLIAYTQIYFLPEGQDSVQLMISHF